MGEPEELIADAALYATRAAAALWRSLGSSPHAPDLSPLRPRLELYLTALFGDCPELLPARAAQPRPRRPWLFGDERQRSDGVAVASNDGRRIRLPACDGAPGEESQARALLRLLAVEQTARVARGSAAALPAERCVADLYALAEASAVDAWIAQELPGMRPLLVRERRAALAARPSLAGLAPRERAVEETLRQELSAPPGRGLAPCAASPAEARRLAEGWAASVAHRGGSYCGLPPVPLWGVLESPAGEGAARLVAHQDPSPARGPARAVARLARRPRVRPALDGEDEGRPGTFVVKASAPEQSVEDPFGAVRPTDRAATPDPGELADALAELPEARLLTSPGSARELLLSDEALPRGSLGHLPAPEPTGLAYPEWDYQRASYRAPGAIVREGPAPSRETPWVEDTLARGRPLVREVRRRFEQLRLERLRLRRQADGPELDLDAFVTQICDERAGCVGNDRLHLAARPLRRDLALAVLVDASASTDAFVSRGRRVIDVEKEALLLLCAALDGLALPAAILAFSGEGPGHVSLLGLKDFGERVDRAVERRIAALEPDRYTRAGAAIRHASARLAREPARQRLLLLLSDGKPNDVDRYAGRYGIEDTRQSIVEARLQGLHFFCLTADRQAPGYAAHLFGARGFAVLPYPERLPGVLVGLLRHLVLA